MWNETPFATWHLTLVNVGQKTTGVCRVLFEVILGADLLQLSGVLSQTIQDIGKSANPAQLRALDQLEEQHARYQGIASCLMGWTNSFHLRTSNTVTDKTTKRLSHGVRSPGVKTRYHFRLVACRYQSRRRGLYLPHRASNSKRTNPLQKKQTQPQSTQSEDHFMNERSSCNRGTEPSAQMPKTFRH